MRLGSHAKFCVADGRRAYVGSANLTGPGLSEHLEIGLLVHGKVAKQIEELWLYSVEIGMFVKVG
jgi:phosphatidylserine/phosphatidylglycerophosphate/cardiolipin synthase-like enzyme